MDVRRIREIVRGELKRRGLNPFRATKETGLPQNALRYLLEGREPKVGRLAEICSALGLEFYVGPPREETSRPSPIARAFEKQLESHERGALLEEIRALRQGITAQFGVSPPVQTPSTPPLDRFSSSVDMPVRGWAKCSLVGNLEDEVEYTDLPAPEGLEDGDAFYAMALGPSMIPEGIEDGDHCLVSPNTPLAIGLRIWLKDRQDRVTIKRLVSETDDSYGLLGWQDPDKRDRQADYHDQWLKSNIAAKGVVLAVYRGKPNAKKPPPLILDPRPPAAPVPSEIIEALSLAEGASLQDAVQVIEKQVSGGETLRDEIVSTLKSETKVLRDEMRSVRDELTIQARNEKTGEVVTLEDDEALVHPGVIEGHDPTPPTLCSLGFHPLPWRRQVRSAAGGGALVEDETVQGYLAFSDEWLQKKHVSPEQSSIIEVLGDSMEPTLGDGSAILVDHRRTHRRHDRIFVVRTEEGLLVKRLMHDNPDWLLVSDNTHYKPLPWPQETQVIGQVMWTGRTLA